MATVKLGRVRPVFKGDYDPALSYEGMDSVRRNGNVYQAIRDVPVGALPEAPDSIYWICIGMKGADGADGKDGADGTPGPQGEPGPQGIQGEQGPQGPAGADGAAGPQGPSGPQGPKGDTPPLYSGVDSAAKDVAATAYAVKTAYDKAVAAENTAVQVGKTPATPDDLGMVRIGQGISVDETGIISIQSGIFQVGEGLELSKEGVLSASTFPVGGIIFWSGAANAIPRGWALCDGKNGTPNLQDKFVLGAGSTYNIGDTGGSTNITVSGTVGSTTIISSQMPKHSHSIYSNTGSQVGVTNGVNNSGANPATVTTSEAGGNMPHTHAATLTAEGDVLPPYYVLAYIMKI